MNRLALLESGFWKSKRQSNNTSPTRIYAAFSYISGMRKSWKRRFENPIILDDGTTLKTLQEAVAYLAKTVPKAEHDMPQVLIAAEMLTKAAEEDAPMEFARIATLKAVNRHHVRTFNPDRKDPHWGKRKLKRDQ